jgi:hypothetical protein
MTPDERIELLEHQVKERAQAGKAAYRTIERLRHWIERHHGPDAIASTAEDRRALESDRLTMRDTFTDVAGR